MRRRVAACWMKMIDIILRLKVKHIPCVPVEELLIVHLINHNTSYQAVIVFSMVLASMLWKVEASLKLCQPITTTVFWSLKDVFLASQHSVKRETWSLSVKNLNCKDLYFTEETYIHCWFASRVTLWFTMTSQVAINAKVMYNGSTPNVNDVYSVQWLDST